MNAINKLIISLLLTINSQAFAGETIEIELPKYVQEELRTTISEEEMVVFKMYAKDIKADLKEAITASSLVKDRKNLEQLKSNIRNIVVSNKERANIYVRYSLNRALALCEILDQEDNSPDNFAVNTQVRIIAQSLKNATLYTEFDFKRYEEFEVESYSLFGADYFSLLTELSKSIIDASAQYKIMIASLEFLQWDLYRDLENSKNAPVITRIYNFLARQPKGIYSDNEFISKIKVVKKFITLLPIRPYLRSIEAHEAKEIIEDASAKNKNFDNASPFEKGESVFVVDGNYEGVKVKEFITYNKPFYSPKSLTHELSTRGNSKTDVLASHFEIFRMKGCLLPGSLCVGEPVNTINGTYTIVAISASSSRALAKNKNNKYYAGYVGGFYKLSGCDVKINICVGDKLVKGYNKYEIKTVTGINSVPGSELFYFGNSIYDDKPEIGSGAMFRGKL